MFLCSTLEWTRLDMDPSVVMICYDFVQLYAGFPRGSPWLEEVMTSIYRFYLFLCEEGY